VKGESMGAEKIEAAPEETEDVRYEDLEKRFGVKRMTIWRRVNRESNPFPKPYRLSNRMTVWKRSEVDAWAESQ